MRRITQRKSKMSEWDFLWDLQGQELLDAQSCGMTYDDIRWLEEQEHQERVKALEEAVKNTNPSTTPIHENPIDRPNVLVFIDAENISTSYYEEIRRILDNLGSRGYICTYALQKAPGTQQWHINVRKYKELHEKRLSGPPAKDKCDKKIVKDVDKLLDDFDNETLIVLVTSDAGFVKSIEEWRQGGYIVIGLGEAKAPDRLRKAYTKFIELHHL